MYAQEVVTTRVDTDSGKISTEGGMPILEYWIRWQEREGVWIHDDVLPSVSIDDEGIEHCSHVRRKVDKVRVRIQQRYIMNVWLQVYGKPSPFAIRIRHPHALKDAVRAAAIELTETYEHIWSTQVPVHVPNESALTGSRLGYHRMKRGM